MTAWQTFYSYRRDRSVTGAKLTKGTVRRVASYAAPYRRDLVLFVVTVVIAAVVGVAFPLLFQRIIDDGIAAGSSRVVVGLALVAVALSLVEAAASLVQRWYSARIGEGLIYDMRRQVFDHVQRMPLAFFTRTQTGALVTRLNNDVLGAQQAFTMTLASVFSNGVTLVLTLVAMLALSWQVTLLSLVLVPLFIIPARRVGDRLHDITKESYALNAAMNTTMTERFNVSGALLVKLFGRQNDELRDFSSKAERVRDIGVIQAMYSRVFFVALTLIASLATALTYGMGGLLAIAGSLTSGEVVALALLLTRLYGPLTALSNVRVDIMSALVSFERVFEVLDLPPMISDSPDAVALPEGARTVEFRAVSFAYPTADDVSLASLESVATLESHPRTQVLREVSFRAEPGQLVALVGPSGAGKTTITQLVGRLYDVSDGAVLIGGLDVRDLTLESLRADIGVVTQDAHMFHDTVEANLRYAKPEATEAELWAALDSAQIGELVRSLPGGLHTVVGDRGYRLSGGEKQRMAIARLLLKGPGIVVLDEATAHLDSESEQAVQRALATALQGRTSLVIAHRLSTVREADQILVVEGGRIVERGRHHELLAQDGLYADLYRRQFRDQVSDPASDNQASDSEVSDHPAPGDQLSDDRA